MVVHDWRKAMTVVRTLREIRLDDQSYQPNSLVDLPSAIAKNLVADGAVDNDKAAVAYCKGEGLEVIKHKTAAATIAAAEKAAAEKAAAEKEAADNEAAEKEAAEKEAAEKEAAEKEAGSATD